MNDLRGQRGDLDIRHGEDDWELARYEWTPDGTARFDYEHPALGRVVVTRTQSKYVVKGGTHATR